MQISIQQVECVLQRARTADRAGSRSGPVKTVSDLADRYGIRREEVRRFTAEAMVADDPARERRLQELARRVESGGYRVDDSDLIDMAERRAIADRSGEL